MWVFLTMTLILLSGTIGTWGYIEYRQRQLKRAQKEAAEQNGDEKA
jgi:hypothetical protein